MGNIFKDKDEARRRESMNTPKKIEEQVLRDLADRRPREFRVQVLGYGKLGQEMHKRLASEEHSTIAEALNQAVIFKRSSRPLRESERGEPHLEDITTKMHRLQKGAIARREYISLQEYYFLQHIYQPGGLTNYLEQANIPNPMSDILVVSPRYGFADKEHIKDIDISEAGLRKVRGTDLEKEVHRTRANLASSFADLDAYRGDVSTLIKEMSKKLEWVKGEKENVDKVLTKAGIVPRDTASISDHLIGARALGEFLKEADYQGFLLAIPNPLDLFSYTLMVSSGIPPSRVMGIENHDETRFTYEFMRRLNEQLGDEPRYSFTEVRIPMFGQHNAMMRPNLSQAFFSGVDNLTGERFYRSDISRFGNVEPLVLDTLGFVAKDYVTNLSKLHQWSAPETVDATLSAISSIIVSDKKGEPRYIQRGCVYAQHYATGHPIFDGFPSALSYRRVSPSINWEGIADIHRKELQKGQDMFLKVVEGFEKIGFLKEFTPEEANSRETEFTKNYQHSEYRLPDPIPDGPAYTPPKQSGTVFNIGNVGTLVKGDNTIITINKKK
jgi:hypothetical protein